jgi:hypothetical protein
MNELDIEWVKSQGAQFIEEGIFHIPNFLPADIVKKIMEEVNSETTWFYQEHGHNFENIVVIKNPETVKAIHEIYDAFLKWPSFEDVENFEAQTVPWVRRRGVNINGNGMAPHWDGDPSPKYVGKGNGELQVPNRVKWGGVIYLNDNFNGGEIDYVELGIKFKPVPGTMIMHIGDKSKYRHGTVDSDAFRYNLIFNIMYGDVNEPEDGEEVHIFKKFE